ncbi:guanosine-diphosphatase [Malassezia yamatoensis]|uniref:guanosine-diphosphatase n=1 Tax=Malassezia yamatoensis TaxID=253288 RepID=A0AAJ5YR59_9BASI|nr:guanosine-diphosphatase [Malassezia yamatoensis]
MQLHLNFSTILHDKAIELGHDVAHPVAALTHHFDPIPALDISQETQKRPTLHPDGARTTRCESAPPVYDVHGKRRPLVQYAIMMDAGSTGSRIHVYKFNYCKPSPELEMEHFDHLEPGLSSYKADAQGAANSLRPLLDSAMKLIPKSLHACTPISLKATAGLRLLPGTQSTEIIQAVRNLLQTQYPFPIADRKDHIGQHDGRGVEIMDGREEGVFAWITVNYLLNLIGAEGPPGGPNPQTVAVLDLGGGSTQIVFEPRITDPEQGMHPGEHVYELRDFENSSFTLYQNSYLGYGLKQARQSVNSLTAFMHLLAHSDSLQVDRKAGGGPLPWEALTPDNAKIPSPCYAVNSVKKASVVHPGSTNTKELTFTGVPGGFQACQRLIEVIMDKDAECRLAPCSFAGVYQPSLSKSFSNAAIVALSYFYDRITPLGLGPTFTIGELRKLAETVCATPAERSTIKGIPLSPEAMQELDQRPEYCLDLTFMHTLFRLGYELDDSRKVTLAKKIGEFELGWALGAELAVLQQGVLCK